ncbi:MAG: RNA pseudouridine synthase [Muribaculaceae bacterium]|nr:RNA pseudouridine synthase [Muribaculaceae bacterium]
MNNPFDYIPDVACEEAFRKLIVRLETLKKSGRPDDVNFCRELEAGKMLGVLIATDSCGVNHTLYAFSGQVGDGGFYYRGFVGPVFDYLQPDGYFKTKEAEISRQNIQIALFEEGLLTHIRSEYECAKDRLDAEVAEYKERCRLSKLERNTKRQLGTVDENELAAMIRQSQFEKAELHRLKKRVASDLESFAIRLKEAQAHLDSLKKMRHVNSEALQNWLFSNFRLLNARGESRSLSEIFAETSMKIPPSGAGECCAPKLLQAAYLQGWRPVAMAEYWYGKSKGGELRIHGKHYPACRGKCLPVLSWMLQGLCIEPPLNSGYDPIVSHNPEIIYENQWFCVVNKPAGMLSVPGKGTAVSVQQWLANKYGSERFVKMAHRLDQDTSGLLIATFGPLPFKVMQSLFATRKVKKTYIAELEGNYKLYDLPRQGCINLPLSPDWLDRPRQRIDFDEGKAAMTDYEFIDVSKGRSRIIFHPLTGRTHQLRVHAASEMGLGIPIVGDRLYGKNVSNGFERLYLHAQKLEFTFPIDGHHYCFESSVPF